MSGTGTRRCLGRGRFPRGREENREGRGLGYPALFWGEGGRAGGWAVGDSGEPSILAGSFSSPTSLRAREQANKKNGKKFARVPERSGHGRIMTIISVPVITYGFFFHVSRYASPIDTPK